MTIVTVWIVSIVDNFCSIATDRTSHRCVLLHLKVVSRVFNRTWRSAASDGTSLHRCVICIKESCAIASVRCLCWHLFNRFSHRNTSCAIGQKLDGLSLVRILLSTGVDATLLSISLHGGPMHSLVDRQVTFLSSWRLLTTTSLIALIVLVTLECLTESLWRGRRGNGPSMRCQILLNNWLSADGGLSSLLCG